MLKLFVMIAVLLLLALAVLGLHHHRHEVTAQSASIISQIEKRKESLYDQRVLIAKSTNPLTLASNLKAAGINPGEAMHQRDVRRNRNNPARSNPATVETDLIAPIRRQ